MSGGIPLILTGNLKIGADTGVYATDLAAAADYSNECTRFMVSSTVEEITIPATMVTPEGRRGGAADYAIEIGFMSTDGNTGALFQELWTSLSTTQLKELAFFGTMRNGAVTAQNPLWYGVFIVSHVDLGGPAQTLSTSSATFPLVGAPAQHTS